MGHKESTPNSRCCYRLAHLLSTYYELELLNFTEVRGRKKLYRKVRISIRLQLKVQTSWTVNCSSLNGTSTSHLHPKALMLVRKRPERKQELKDREEWHQTLSSVHDMAPISMKSWHCGYLPASILWPGWERIVWSLTSNWGAIGSWWPLRVGKLLLFSDDDNSKLPMIEQITSHQVTHKQP